MQTSFTETTICEHNNTLYAIDSEPSDWFGEDTSSSLSLGLNDVPPPITPTPSRSPLRVETPGRNIDMMMIKKTTISKFTNRLSLLQRFQSISRRRKMEINNDKKQLPTTLPSENTRRIPNKSKARASAPWEAYSRKNYFRGELWV